MIEVTALPASDGDCLWVEWPHDGRRYRALIDGGRGRTPTRRLNLLPPDDRHVDLLVCTHIDSDHIEGLINLFTDPPAGFTVGQVWFNGQRHIRQDLLGPRQGSRLEWLLDKATVPWNAAFGGSAVVVPDGGPLPVVRLPGLTLTLLAPGWAELARLDAAWPEVLAEGFEPLQGRPAHARPDPDADLPLAELASRPYEPDLSPANGSSIAFLAEHDEGGRVLFAADSPAEALLRGLWSMTPDRPVPVDLVKAPHHGSGHNINSDLVAAVDCGHWLFSTSGARHGHPDRRAVARIVTGAKDPVLWFNYRTAATEEYADPAAAVRHGFRAVHPAPGPGIGLAVSPGRVEPIPPR
jgi:hypothetical protein